jgi:lambda repressor-like predicted transcriptional regulator
MLAPAQIKKRLRKKGLTLTKVARQNGVALSTLSHILSGKRKTPRLRKAVADALGLEYSVVWERREKPEAEKHVARLLELRRKRAQRG